jgi:hypothetical protein
MGGWGSGSYYKMRRAKEKTGSSLPLDIRELKRKGLLVPGGSMISKWSRGGNVHSSIRAIVHEKYLLLRYTHQKTEDVEQKIYFAYTPCNYGGERIWFMCPSCGRRCAIIYSYGKYFACRICCNLTYESCNETPRDRRFNKANKLRERIGARPGAFNPLPYSKPKGMHQTSWDRIMDEIQQLERIGIAQLGRMLGVRNVE